MEVAGEKMEQSVASATESDHEGGSAARRPQAVERDCEAAEGRGTRTHLQTFGTRSLPVEVAGEKVEESVAGAAEGEQEAGELTPQPKRQRLGQPAEEPACCVAGCCVARCCVASRTRVIASSAGLQDAVKPEIAVAIKSPPGFVLAALESATAQPPPAPRQVDEEESKAPKKGKKADKASKKGPRPQDVEEESKAPEKAAKADKGGKKGQASKDGCPRTQDVEEEPKAPQKAAKVDKGGKKCAASKDPLALRMRASGGRAKSDSTFHMC